MVYENGYWVKYEFNIPSIPFGFGERFHVGTPDCPTGDNSSFPVSQPLSLPRIFFLPRAPIPILFLFIFLENTIVQVFL
jgi:hypothetical protein